MKKILLAFIVIYSMIFSTACLTKQKLETFQSRSKQISTIANSGVNITRKLYREGVISLADKDFLADGLIWLGEGGEVVDSTLKEAIEKYGSNPPKDAMQQAVKLFRSNILERFLQLLEKMKIIAVSAELRQTIELIKTSVLVIAGVLQIKQETKTAIKLAEAK